MKLITIDGYPASGKTTVRIALKDKYNVLMPERYYSETERALEEIWQDRNIGDAPKPPFLSNFFPLLTFKRIHPSSRVAQANYVSMEDFYAFLHDLMHQTDWDLAGKMQWYFKNIVKLDFEYYTIKSYFLDVPLEICQSRRPNFNWDSRKKWEKRYGEIWDWIAERKLVEVIDGTQSIDDIVEQIAREVKLV